MSKFVVDDMSYRLPAVLRLERRIVRVSSAMANETSVLVRTFNGLPSLVSEYMPNGKLFSLPIFQITRQIPYTGTVFNYIRNYPSTEHRNEIMLGVAEGLHYLHCGSDPRDHSFFALIQISGQLKRRK